MRRTVALPLAVLLAACCAASVSARVPLANSASAARAQAHRAAALPAGSRLLRSVSAIPSSGYAAGGSLYLTQTAPYGEHTGEVYELSRINPRSGRVVATQRFDAQLDSLLLAGGSLWATTGATSATLWRLDPSSMRVRSHAPMPTSTSAEGVVGSLAAAGGSLWVGAGELDRVSLATGAVTRVVRVPFRGPVQLASDSAGRFLVATVGYDAPVHLVRLNPRSGAVLSQRTLPRRGAQPVLGGIVAGGVWIESTIGAKTVIARFVIDTLEQAPSAALARKASRVSVRVLNGLLWVTEPLGEANLNYCANPLSGRPLVELPLLPGDSVLLAASASSVFYTDVPVNAHSVKLETAPISRGCKA